MIYCLFVFLSFSFSQPACPFQFSDSSFLHGGIGFVLNFFITSRATELRHDFNLVLKFSMIKSLDAGKTTGGLLHNVHS